MLIVQTLPTAGKRGLGVMCVPRCKDWLAVDDDRYTADSSDLYAMAGEYATRWALC
jgi:hypothetical protein